MCVEFKHENITIELVRDPSIRAYEVVVVNHNRQTGEEKQGIRLLCRDSGMIGGWGSPDGVNLMEGVDLV